MIVEWDASRVFPALDLARMTVLHPDAAKSERSGYWKDVLGAALTTCLALGDAAGKEVAVPMLTMRLICNCYRGGSGAADAAGSLIERFVEVLMFARSIIVTYNSDHCLTLLHRILDCIEICSSSANKNARLATATALLNTSSYMHSSSSSSTNLAVRILDLVGIIAASGTYESEAISRVLLALGTVLLIPGSCGEEAKRTAKERGMLSMLERVASGNDLSVATAKEIRSILS
jgi:phospholipase A-2-activating protein